MAQMSSISLPFQPSTVKELLDMLSSREKTARKLRQHVLLSLPDSFFEEGNDLWWEREIVLGKKEIQEGKIHVASSRSDLKKLLKQ